MTQGLQLNIPLMELDRTKPLACIGHQSNGRYIMSKAALPFRDSNKKLLRRPSKDFLANKVISNAYLSSFDMVQDEYIESSK